MLILVCKSLMFNLHVSILLFIPSPLLSSCSSCLFLPFFFYLLFLCQYSRYMYASMHVSKYPLSHVLLCVIVSTPFQSLFSSPIVSLKSSSCLFILNFFISSLYPSLKHTCIFLLFLPVLSHSLCLLTPVSFPLFLPFFSPLFFSPPFSHLHLCTIIHPYFLGHFFSAYCVWISCLFLKALQMSKAIVYMW